MTHEDDAVRRLAAADPASVPGAVAEPTSPAARAILHEVKHMSTESSTTATTPPPAPLPWWQRPAVVAAAAIAVLVVGVGYVIADDSEPMAPLAPLGSSIPDDVALPDDDLVAGGPITPGDGNTQITNCVELYSPETLQNRDYALDGTITAIDDATNQVTFAVNEWFRGGEGDTAVKDGNVMNHGLLDPETSFDVGTRVLVAGDDDFVWSCGFTQLHSDEVADEWRTALG